MNILKKLFQKPSTPTEDEIQRDSYLFELLDKIRKEKKRVDTEKSHKV